MVRIYEFLKRTGIGDRDELAKRLGVSRKAVDSWSSGGRNPTYDMCIQLMELGMTVEELFGYPYPSSASPRGDMDETVKAIVAGLKEELKRR